MRGNRDNHGEQLGWRDTKIQEQGMGIEPRINDRLEEGCKMLHLNICSRSVPCETRKDHQEQDGSKISTLVSHKTQNSERP